MEVVEYHVPRGRILRGVPLLPVHPAPLEDMAALLPQRAIHAQGPARPAITAPQAQQESSVILRLRRQILRLPAPQEDILQGAQHPLLTVLPAPQENMEALLPQRLIHVQDHVRPAISAPQAQRGSTVAQLLRRQLLRLLAQLEHILQVGRLLRHVRTVQREHMGALQPQQQLHVQDPVPQAIIAPRALQAHMAAHLHKWVAALYIYVQGGPIALQGLVHLYYVPLEHTITHLERQESKSV